MTDQDKTSPQGRRQKILNILLRLIGLGLFIWILNQVDLAATFASLRKANPWMVLAGVSFFIPIILTRSVRTRIILKSLGVRLNLAQALLIRIVGAAAGDMLPGRTGELVSIAYLQQAGHGLRDPTLALVLDRLFDFLILAIVSVIGLVVIGQELQVSIVTLKWTMVIAAVIFGIVILALLVMRARLDKVSRLLERITPTRWRIAVQTLLRGSYQSTFEWNAQLLGKILAISLISYILLVLRGYFLARSIGIGLSLSFLAICMSITTILQLIPISNVMGIGTREVSLVFLFGLVGVSAELAISFSFLIVLALLVQDVIGLVIWWRYPVGTAALNQISETESSTSKPV